MHQNDPNVAKAPPRVVLERPGNVVAVSLLPNAGYDIASCAERGTIGFAFDGQTGWHSFASDRMSPFHRRPNTLAWVPPACEVRSCSREGGEYLLVDGLAPNVGDGDWEQTFSDVVDPAALAAAAFLRRVLARRVSADQVAIEHAVDTLVAIAERRVRSGPREPGIRLTGSRLAALDALIDARMEQGLTVPEMAQTLGLSLGYFMRIVRSDLGVTPHAYLMDRRLARARRRLAAGHSIAETAIACGFAHQSHLTRLMGRSLGVTPTGRPTRGGRDEAKPGGMDAASS